MTMRVMRGEIATMTKTIAMKAIAMTMTTMANTMTIVIQIARVRRRVVGMVIRVGRGCRDRRRKNRRHRMIDTR